MSKLLPEEKKKVAKPMLWISMASMAMAFAGLTSGYIVSRSALLSTGEWMVFSLPGAFTWATVVIVISSITMVLASSAATKGQQSQTTLMLFVTLALGLFFAGLQFVGWRQLFDSGIYFTGPGSSTAGSWVYAISFFHLLHLLGGLISLLVTALKSAAGKYSSTEKQGIELAAIFWHFLDLLWIFLYLFLIFIR